MSKARRERRGLVSLWSRFRFCCNKRGDSSALPGVKSFLAEVHDVVASEGLIVRRRHSDLSHSIDRLIKQGRLVAVLPGIYAYAEHGHLLQTRVRAAMQVCPTGVITGQAAAKLSFWPELAVSEVVCAHPGRRVGQPGITFTRRRIPGPLVLERRAIRITTPALTALDLCESVGGDGIDTALRARVISLADLHAALALTPDRPGNQLRRELVADSRDEPWSHPERLFHRILRTGGLVGWATNHLVRIENHTFYLDVAFPEHLVAVEIDGRAHHSSAAAFERDRWRQNQLILAGWRVLRFTWQMVTGEPEAVLAAVRQALRG